MSRVQLRSVQKSYGSTHVVRGLTLEVGSGELIALLGPSGCGKTTTLRMLAGLERADAGEILIADRCVDGPKEFVPPEQRGLGMVFQSYAIWPHRSVAENVAYPLRLRGTPRAERGPRVNEALGWVRLAHLADRRPHELSGGQLQRVALARALVAGPKVLLLDEPLSNLDQALREELRAEIAGLRARLGTTMVYVTHDQNEALALADRVGVMNQGVLEQLAPPERLYGEPATPFVASFVGGANVLDGFVEGASFTSAGVRFELPEATIRQDGPATLVVRPEELELGATGTALRLTARLFLGHVAEYRFLVGDVLLRLVGPARAAHAGDVLTVTVRRARLFPAARGRTATPPRDDA